MLDKEWRGIENLEDLSTRLIPHHGSGTSAVAGKSDVGCHVLPPSEFMLLLKDC